LGVDDENLRNKKKYELPKLNEKTLRKFQASLRGILIKNRFKYIKAKMLKNHDSKLRNILYVTKRHYIKNNLIYEFKLIYDKNNKVLNVTCKPVYLRNI